MAKKKINDNIKKEVYFYTLMVFLIVIISYGIHRYYEVRSEEEYLRNHGVHTKAIVTKIHDGNRGIDIWYIYQIQGKSFQQIEKLYIDSEQICVGDSIEIVYDPIEPTLAKTKTKLEIQ